MFLPTSMFRKLCIEGKGVIECVGVASSHIVTRHYPADTICQPACIFWPAVLPTLSLGCPQQEVSTVRIFRCRSAGGPQAVQPIFTFLVRILSVFGYRLS
jgi:hypothetical protein